MDLTEGRREAGRGGGQKGEGEGGEERKREKGENDGIDREGGGSTSFPIEKKIFELKKRVSEKI